MEDHKIFQVMPARPDQWVVYWPGESWRTRDSLALDPVAYFMVATTTDFEVDGEEFTEYKRPIPVPVSHVDSESDSDLYELLKMRFYLLHASSVTDAVRVVESNRADCPECGATWVLNADWQPINGCEWVRSHDKFCKTMNRSA